MNELVVFSVIFVLGMIIPIVIITIKNILHKHWENSIKEKCRKWHESAISHGWANNESGKLPEISSSKNK